MVEIESTFFKWIPAIPLAAALVLYPVAGLLGRRFAIWASLIAIAITSVLVGKALLLVVTTGHFDASPGTWSGARLTADLFGVEFVGDPASLCLAFAFALAFALGIIGAASAWGGGERRQPTPTSAGQILALLFLFGVVELGVLARGLHVAIAVAPITSAITFGVLLAARPRQTGLEGASRVFTAQRIADAMLLFSLGFIWLAHHTFDPLEIARSLSSTSATEMFFDGPLLNSPKSAAWKVAAVLLSAGALLRLACFPWVSIARQAIGAPAPVVGLVVGTTSLGMPLVILLKAAPVLFVVPDVLYVVAIVALASATFHALVAAATRNMLAVDVHLTSSLALVGATSVFVGEQFGAVLVVAVVGVGSVLLALPASAVIEAMQGQTNLFNLGGLGRPLRRTQIARWLATTFFAPVPGGPAWIVFCFVLWTAFTSTSGTTLVSGGLLLTALVLSFASYRSLHLQFGGDVVRGEAPARLVEVRWYRWAISWVVVSVTLVGAALYAFPAIVSTWLKLDDTVTLSRFMRPSLRAGEVALAAAPDANFAASTSTPGSFALVAVVGLAGVLGWVLSSLFYRRGPSTWHVVVARNPIVLRASKLLNAGTLLEALIDRIITAPAMKGARFLVQTVLPTLIVAPPNRLPAVPANIVGFVLRIIHNGDMQRGLLFLVVSAAGLLWWWSIR